MNHLIGRNLVLTALLGLSLLSVAVAGPVPPGTGHYVGAGVVVAAQEGDPAAGTGNFVFVDNGAVTCVDTDGDQVPDHGQGGVCIPFGVLAGDSVSVLDASVLIGPDVAFQVCVDVSGDNACTIGGNASDCERDIIFFSHDTATGDNYNPLYVDPLTSEWAFKSCGSAGFPGYVVITCAGVHADSTGTGTHPHEATEGFVSGAVTGGTLQGDFCGAPAAFKVYNVVT